MKILHIIDDSYFQSHKKTISDIILSFCEYKVSQRIITKSGCPISWLSSQVGVDFIKPNKKGRVNTLVNKIFIWRKMFKFAPDIVIKWGADARKLAGSGSFVQVSFTNEIENLSSFDKSDYIMTNFDYVLDHLKSNGFSGAKSFILPPFVKQYKNVVEISKRDFFIPEKSKIVYIAGGFLKNIGYENLFDIISSVSDTYFLITGSGKDEDYIKDYASRVNVKSRCRFINEIENSLGAIKIADMAFLPFNDAELAKNILEVWFQKKPLLTLKNNISLEFITPEKNGVLVSTLDNYILRKAIKEFTTLDKEKLSEMAQNGFCEVQNYLDERVIPLYLNTLWSLVSKYRGRNNLLDNPYS